MKQFWMHFICITNAIETKLTSKHIHKLLIRIMSRYIFLHLIFMCFQAWLNACWKYCVCWYWFAFSRENKFNNNSKNYFLKRSHPARCTIYIRVRSLKELLGAATIYTRQRWNAEAMWKGCWTTPKTWTRHTLSRSWSRKSYWVEVEVQIEERRSSCKTNLG